MEIRVNRFGYGADSSVGRMYVDDLPLFYTLEDEVRDGPKVPGETAIPSGYIYDVTPRTTGGMTQRYAERFPDLHQGMAWLRDVPGFAYVYIHVGNTDDDTEGVPRPRWRVHGQLLDGRLPSFVRDDCRGVGSRGARHGRGAGHVMNVS
jgi:hypothetical protein